ncbi:helix-turn-helix domain-containing protein [Megamonas hypermegale]|uniref:helix-turn-helix domain-containing protein n=1 Tax=Megamonas hypermegale TaxID=158847 RepID=UPI0026F27F7A|nr:helix-turn-helix transcriptional regulator [Megamonas hypermegale]
MALKDKIKSLRKSKGLTQSQLGKLINKSSQVISNWERGYTSSINQDDIKNLANALSVSASDLLEDIDFTNDKKEVEEKKPADLEKFLNQSEVMFDGEVMKLDEEDRQEIRNALEFIFYKAKKKK